MIHSSVFPHNSACFTRNTPAHSSECWPSISHTLPQACVRLWKKQQDDSKSVYVWISLGFDWPNKGTCSLWADKAEHHTMNIKKLKF